MVDVFSMEKRHEIMKKIHNKNTKPEVKIRKELWAKGYRYRINYAELPGKPDIVFIKRRKVIFIHGCFWHGHKECKKNTEPATHAVFLAR
jgi:DNA mismatch endonuclease (patch repair protein)